MLKPQKVCKPLLVTIPHSGECVPEEAPWLARLPETLLMFDVDRFVDRLYEPVLHSLQIPNVKTQWHRYAVDLNRLRTDVDCDSVEGSQNPSGKFPRGLHWRITTQGETLMPKPVSQSLHQQLIAKYFVPFHEHVNIELDHLRQAGAKTTYHIDAHSMPSVGTSEHRDPGEKRADIVVSDCHGKSCSAFFKELVIDAYSKAGFKVAYNWPYFGGGVTETYGRPEKHQEAIQVELNRSLYMDEKNKSILNDRFLSTQGKINVAIDSIFRSLPDLT